MSLIIVVLAMLFCKSIVGRETLMFVCANAAVFHRPRPHVLVVFLVSC